jgi:hypothetical protein
MTSQDHVTVLLHIDPASEPISGRVEASGGSSEFVGWLGLASVIERALDGGEADAEDAPDGSRG